MARYVYKIENTVSGNCYIGSTKDPVRRWKDHRVNRNSVIKEDRDMYGISAFTFEVLCEHEVDADAFKQEKEFIATLNPYYNSAKGEYRGPVILWNRKDDTSVYYSSQSAAIIDLGLRSNTFTEVKQGKRRHTGGYSIFEFDDFFVQSKLDRAFGKMALFNRKKGPSSDETKQKIKNTRVRASYSRSEYITSRCIITGTEVTDFSIRTFCARCKCSISQKKVTFSPGDIVGGHLILDRFKHPLSMQV